MILFCQMINTIYKLGLETKISAYKGNKKHINVFELINQIKELKDDCEWLKQCPSQALQASIKNLDVAYKNDFFLSFDETLAYKATLFVSFFDSFMGIII
jgi:transposase